MNTGFKEKFTKFQELSVNKNIILMKYGGFLLWKHQ